MQKVAIFVDVQNIYYTTRQAYACNFDYNVFWSKVTAGRELVKAVAYATERGDEKQRQFQNILKAIGFELKLKPFIQRSDGTSKGDWDVGITIDVLDAAPSVDLVVLASGDGDFDLLLNKIKVAYGVETEVYGVEKLTANSLIYEAARFIPINNELLLKK